MTFAGGQTRMKRRCSLAEIRAEMQRRIDSSEWGGGYCLGCPAPTPYRIPHDGIANWTANIAATPKPGCESPILKVVDDVRRDYDLPPESVSEVIGRFFFRRQVRARD
jgi:hypothetical protein